MPGGDASEFETLLHQGQACRLAGDLDEAAQHLAAAIQLEPNSVPALMEQGLLRQQQCQWTQARECFTRVQSVQPDNPQILDAIGYTWQAQLDFDQAILLWRRAVKLKPDYADVWQNLGLAHEHRGELPEAISCHQQAATLRPEQSKAHRLLGTAQLDYGVLPAAQKCFDRALELAPDDPEAMWQRFFLRALTGDFPGAWADYECRFQLPARTTPDPQFAAPRWNGEPLPGQTLLLHAEQGFGDTIQMIRYAPRAAERAGRILLWAPAPLRALMATAHGVDEVTTTKPTEGTFAAHLPLMSLPGVFGDSLETIPREIPYLGNPSPRERGKPMKIGLAWAGSGNQPLDRRSVTLSDLTPLLAVGNVEWHSLQLGEAAGEISGSAWVDGVQDRSGQLTDFAATAAVMGGLDLVICVDTAVAHLAGALGQPVWLLLSFAPDWRWGHDGETSPWYPSARLFRQGQGEGWRAVAQRMAGALEVFAG
jgi:tetratricopeptide (TPR) repeat protein